MSDDVVVALLGVVSAVGLGTVTNYLCTDTTPTSAHFVAGAGFTKDDNLLYA